MKFYILLLFFASSYALDFNCLKGPTFWCANLENAQKCGRVTECFMNNRNNDGVVKMSNGKSNPVYCEICKEVIHELENKFIPKMTEKQFIDFVLNNVCTKLDDKMKALCLELVPTYGPLVYQQLVKYLDPANFCASMNLCQQQMNIQPIITASPETCKICKEVFTFLESVLTSVTPDELKSMLKLLVCSQLPSEVKNMCNSLVDEYTNQLYELLKSLLDGNRVCPALHLCPSEITPTISSASWQCQTCIDLIVVFRKDLSSVSAADIENLIITKVCEKLPFIARGFCKDNVDKFVPLFFNDLHSQLTPQQICAKNTICGVPHVNKRSPITTVKGVIKCDTCEVIVGEIRKILLTEAGELKVKNFIKNKICKYFGAQTQQCVSFVDKYADILINFINTKLTTRQICELFGACSENKDAIKITTTSKKLNGVECEACELFLKEIKSFISDPTRETKFKDFLKNTVCPLFDEDKIQCQQVVDEYFNIIFNAIISEFDVDKICKYLKYCSSTVVVTASKPASVECDVCEVVMSEVIDLVTTNATQQRVLQFLNTEICPKLGILSSQCVNVVDTYLPYLFQIARTSLNSKLLCARLHLCTLVSQQNVQAMLKSVKVKSFQCDLCQFVISETHALLSDTTIQSLLENFLKQEICPHFGAKAQECVNDITEYYSFIVNLVLEFATPSLCADVHLCMSQQKLNIPRSMIELTKSRKAVECDVCPLFYKFLNTMTINTPNNDIVLGLVGICGRFYHNEKTKCLNMLKKVDTIFDAYKNAKNEKQFCEMSEMCSVLTPSRPLLSQKQCTWGPSFWCISRRHATFCGIGAVRHCELNVWRQHPTD